MKKIEIVFTKCTLLFLLCYFTSNLCGCTYISDKMNEVVGGSKVEELEKRERELEFKEKELAKANKSEESSSENEQTKKSSELNWNYKGNIGGIPIKAQIDYQEAEHQEGSGAVDFPFTGYYFYESQNKKIPFHGDANGIGMISFVAKTNTGDEFFDGEFTTGQLESFAGTWTKGSKSLNFVLYAQD
jgi:hypothetical protein